MKTRVIFIKGNPNKQHSIKQTKLFYNTLIDLDTDLAFNFIESNVMESEIEISKDNIYILFSRGERYTKYLLSKVLRDNIIHIGTSNFYRDKVGLWLKHREDETGSGSLKGNSLLSHWTMSTDMIQKFNDYITKLKLSKTIIPDGFYTKEKYIQLRSREEYNNIIKEIHDKSFGTNLTQKDISRWDSDSIIFYVYNNITQGYIRTKYLDKNVDSKYFIDNLKKILYISDLCSVVPGTGKKLMEEIHKVKETIMLRAHTKELINYYKNFGYTLVPKEYNLKGNLMIRLK